ncbi:hypothetical protein M413DRAFT_380614 [Hebeloma cylindrosporum]|uniref:DUF6699 domain-containing protein n=1 Tax=Hebeloma cylindrosporum TaxID=76867 RepID=A0A0C3BU52_HEBCY|nr:hypothetical protein M413DRAFT_380614 [Hebeloma cylindrosporum h7]
MFSDMPPLVDQNPPFYPPPQGAADGGEPGFGFSSARSPHGTPYPAPHQPLSPWSTAEPPNSARSWTYGQQPPSGAPSWLPPQQQPPVWGQTPASPWGPTTPAGTWGALSPPASYAPATPSGYPGFVGYGPQPPSPFFGPGPVTPYESSSGQPITSGWFGADNVQHRKKKKKRHSFGEQSWGGEQSQGWDGQMTRSNSLAVSNARVPLQRSASWGHLNFPAYGREPYNILNLARRPRDWRPDYTARDGIAALATYLPKLGRSKSDVQEYSDPTPRNLHPLLLWDPKAPPIYFNLRNGDPFTSSSNIHFLKLNRPHNHIDLAQLVCQPSADFLRLSHPRLPWYIDVFPKHPNGVTVGDIFERIHRQLHVPIQDNHFFNEELNEVDRSHLTFAFQDRVGDNPVLRAAGIFRVDFLGDKCVFEGLVRGQRGVWEMKMSRVR